MSNDEYNEQQIKELSDYVRYLSLMAIQRANSGHPGLPLGCAEIGNILYGYFLNGSSNNPTWVNRDRFILSAGHGSMLLYALNHLYGYDISLEDIVNFRQLGSKTAGHPEYDLKDGIETTTGPLGQGFANAVGAAIESKMLSARFNTEDISLFDFKTYVLMGDGCMMEGITNEAASIAGFLGLDNLVAIYDYNKITIDGSTDITFAEDVADRYRAMGWITCVLDVNNLEAFYIKLKTFAQVSNKRPKLIIVQTTIGEGLNKLKGSHKVHGAPAGEEEINYFLERSTLARFFPISADTISEQLARGCFFDKQPYKEHLSGLLARRSQKEKEWQNKFKIYQKKYPGKYYELQKYQNKEPSEKLKNELLHLSTGKDATRGVISNALQIAAKYCPGIIGGSADLVGSTKATIKNSTYVNKDDFWGRNIAFGVREHAMGAIGNGLALNRYFIPFTSTFFTFIDYMKPAVRLAAIMQLKHLFIFTHDSIYVGEDGPTHEPIEHLGATRLIPGLYTFRPANDVETGFSFCYFLENEGPVVILGSRQSLNEKVFQLDLDREKSYLAFKKGAYVFSDSDGEPDIVLAGSGSEVSTLLEGKALLEQKGSKVRLVSIPCVELFEEAGRDYQKKLLGNGSIPVILMEAASQRGHKLFYQNHIHVLGMESFGVSGSGKAVAEHFAFTAESVCQKALSLL